MTARHKTSLWPVFTAFFLLFFRKHCSTANSSKKEKSMCSRLVLVLITNTHRRINCCCTFSFSSSSVAAAAANNSWVVRRQNSLARQCELRKHKKARLLRQRDTHQMVADGFALVCTSVNCVCNSQTRISSSSAFRLGSSPRRRRSERGVQWTKQSTTEAVGEHTVLSPPILWPPVIVSSALAKTMAKTRR